MGDLLVADLSSMVWTNISSVSFGTPPSPRFHHGFTVSDGKLYVFGGCNDASGAIDGGPGTNDGSKKEGRGGGGVGERGEGEGEGEGEGGISDNLVYLLLKLLIYFVDIARHLRSPDQKKSMSKSDNTIGSARPK